MENRVRERVNFKRLFQNKNYMLYWFASSLSMSASNIIQFVLSLYVLDKTGSGTIFASILSIIIIPRILLSPVAGVIGDNVNKIKFMCILTFISSIILSIFSILSAFNNSLSIGSIYVLVVLLEIIEIFYAGPSSAIIPELVPKQFLNEAISLSKLDDGIVLVITPMLSALLYGKLKLTGGLLAATILLFISSILTILIRHSNTKILQTIDKEKNSYIQDFKDGLRIIEKNSFLKRFIFISPIVNFFFSSTFSVSVIFLLREIFGVSEYTYGLYNSITSSMVIIVPIFVIPIVKKYSTENLINLSVKVVSISLFFIAIASLLGIKGLIPITISIIIITIFDCVTIAIMMPVQMSVSVLYQTTIPKEYLSRVLSICRMLSLISIPLGRITFGVMVDLMPVYVSIFIGSLGVGATYLLCKNTFNKKLK